MNSHLIVISNVVIKITLYREEIKMQNKQSPTKPNHTKKDINILNIAVVVVVGGGIII